MGWRFKPQGISQCDSELQLQTLKDQFAEEGGCRLFGILELNQASGNFHIAPHKNLQKGGMVPGLVSILDLLAFTFSQFNITHTINTLSFGDQFPGISSPLDGQSRSVEDTHGMYQYYVKIVPTKYTHLNKKVIESNQYSVTEHLRHLAPGSGRGLPGLYFYYEISPIEANFEEKPKLKGGFLKFLTNVCAIVGGTFTVFGLLENIINYLINLRRKSSL